MSFLFLQIPPLDHGSLDMSFLFLQILPCWISPRTIQSNSARDWNAPLQQPASTPMHQRYYQWNKMRNTKRNTMRNTIQSNYIVLGQFLLLGYSLTNFHPNVCKKGTLANGKRIKSIGCTNSYKQSKNIKFLEKLTSHYNLFCLYRLELAPSVRTGIFNTGN